MSAERLLEGRKHFSQSVMVYVAVSKLGKTVDGPCVCAAKISSVHTRRLGTR